MVGAGIFAAIGPAATAAGSGLLIGLVLAGMVAYANATSSAQLAAVYPDAGGTYVYGRVRLGPFWGYLAGWGFVVGKTASLAAMALTFGAYAVPGRERMLAIGAVVAMTAVNYLGVRKTLLVTRVILAVVLTALTVVVVVALGGGDTDPANLTRFHGGVFGVLQSAGLMFFAFAGYARIATLGEEVVDPQRTIPRAIPIALGLALAVYVVVTVSVLLAVGPAVLATAPAPLVAATSSGPAWVSTVVRVGGTVASLGVLLSLLAGVSRTVLAMARNRELPGPLDAVHPRFGTPHRAELAVAVVVVVLVSVTDLRGAIGFSSFTVLTYYAIANAAAWTQPQGERRWPRWLQALGIVGCVMLAVALPLASVVAGVGVLGVGAIVWLISSHRPPDSMSPSSPSPEVPSR